MAMIDRTKNGEWSSGAVQGLETVAQSPRVHWREFDVQFWTGPFLGKSRWPVADGRTARFVDRKDQRLGEEAAVVRRGILWGRRWEVLLRWGLRSWEIRPGEGTSRKMQEAHGRLLCWQGRNAEISRIKRGERECVDRRVMVYLMSGEQNRRRLSRAGLLENEHFRM